MLEIRTQAAEVVVGKDRREEVEIDHVVIGRPATAIGCGRR